MPKVWEEVEAKDIRKAVTPEPILPPFSIMPDSDGIVVCDADQGSCEVKNIPSNIDIEQSLPGHCELVWVTLPNGEE